VRCYGHKISDLVEEDTYSVLKCLMVIERASCKERKLSHLHPTLEFIPSLLKAITIQMRRSKAELSIFSDTILRSQRIREMRQMEMIN
jgi:hypothetical protein